MLMSHIFFKSTFEDYADEQILLQLMIVLIANNQQLLIHFDHCIQTEFFPALLCGFLIITLLN